VSFVSPMMAKVLPEDFDGAPGGNWIAEEKFDGHRIVVSVEDRAADLFGGRAVTAWSRYGIERSLPPHIRDAFQELPTGTYDGELLVPGERSYGTVVLENSPKLVYVVFDVICLMGKDLTIGGLQVPWTERRGYLAEIFRKTTGSHPVHLAHVTDLTDRAQVGHLAKEVWDRDGEGLILKNVASLYCPGKRPKNAWYKIKQLRSAVLTVVGFREGTMGPNSVVVLRDDDGVETTVKWKNYEWLDKLQADPKSFMGRKLRIEFQEKTADGSYRHPRWDRWEDE